MDHLTYNHVAANIIKYLNITQLIANANDKNSAFHIHLDDKEVFARCVYIIT